MVGKENVIKTDETQKETKEIVASREGGEEDGGEKSEGEYSQQ